MVKIPIEINQERLVLVVVLHVEGARGFPFLRTSLIVDTGAPFTLISSVDFKRLNLPISILNYRNHTKIGGCTVECSTMNRRTQLSLKDLDGKQVSFNFADFAFIKPRDAMTDTLPGLLGVDFLRVNKLRLFFSPTENIAYLESLD
jgi:hypothetical protein